MQKTLLGTRQGGKTTCMTRSLCISVAFPFARRKKKIEKASQGLSFICVSFVYKRLFQDWGLNQVWDEN